MRIVRSCSDECGRRAGVKTIFIRGILDQEETVSTEVCKVFKQLGNILMTLSQMICLSKDLCVTRSKPSLLDFQSRSAELSHLKCLLETFFLSATWKITSRHVGTHFPDPWPPGLAFATFQISGEGSLCASVHVCKVW